MTNSTFAQDVSATTLAAVRRNDREAQEAVFRQFQRPVFVLAMRICRNEDEAMDVLQDTFVNVFTRIAQFKGDAPFWGWLRRIAVNTALGRLRKLRRQELTLVSRPEDPAPDRPDRQLDLAEAFGRLPVDTRAVVWLYDVEGYSHQEIAQLFGRSVSFSKTQLSRARARLRELLEGEGARTEREAVDPDFTRHDFTKPQPCNGS